MKKVAIRNQSIHGGNQRIFDYICDEEGHEMIQVKAGKTMNWILLSDMEEQIKTAREEKNS